MGHIHDAGRGIVQAFLSDEVRPILFATVGLSLLGYSLVSLYVVALGGVMCAIIAIVYMIEERQIMKFFWAGFVLSIVVLLYTAAIDLNTLRLSTDVILKDRVKQVAFLASAGALNGYAAEKYLGGTRFMSNISEQLYNRDILLMSDNSSWFENFCVVTCTDDLNLLDMTRLTNKRYVFAVPSGSRISLIGVKSNNGLMDLAAVLQEETPKEGVPCNRCSERGTYRISADPFFENSGIEDISGHHSDLCESCIMDMLKLATDTGEISESDLYARIA